MKKIAAIIFSALFCSISAFSQIKFSSNFEAGAMGNISMINDSSFIVHGHRDPANPIDTTLEPSQNWYYFRMTGMKGMKVRISMPDTYIPGCSWSADGNTWNHFSPEENTAKGIKKVFDCDTCYVASFIPYTYSHHLKRMEQWKLRSCVESYSIGSSTLGRDMQVLRITDPNASSEKKKRIWMHARIHPSEAPASHLLDALIEHLTDDSPESKAIRSKLDFYILPIINPDGVAQGLSRSNSLGVNMEINYGRCADSTSVEIANVKAELERLTATKPLDMIINHHSQKEPYATFWIHKAEGTSDAYFIKQMIFATLCCFNNEYMNLSEMSYSDIAPRYVEGWIWNRFADKTLALTFETPYSFYHNGDINFPVTLESLNKLAKTLLHAIDNYLNINFEIAY